LPSSSQGLLTVGGFSAAAQEKLTLEDIHAAKVDPNVIYGMYSGLALVMDVYHPRSPMAMQWSSCMAATGECLRKSALSHLKTAATLSSWFNLLNP